MPDWKKLIRRHLAALKLSPVREAEIAEELAQYAEERSRELQLDGMTEAADAVVPGGASQGHLFSDLAQDFRYGFRTLRQSPGFAVIGILALALSIGANTAIFSVINGVLLQPLGYPNAGQLLKIFETTSEFSHSSVAYPNYLDWRRASRSFSDMGTYRRDDFNFTGAGEPEQLGGEYVSASLFPVLGIRPLLGRNFQPAEDEQGTSCTTILSYGLWQRRFGGDANIVGRKLTLNAVNCTVVGVWARDFSFSDAQVYLPIEQWKSIELRTREMHPGLEVVARLKQGVTMEAAQAEMASISSALAHEYPATNATHSAKVVRMKDDIVGSIRPTLLLLLGAVGFVLIIACANVANLLLARSTARRREFAIRAALGAQRWRVIRQLLAESVLLSAGGALLGLLLARWGTNLVLAAVPGSLPRAGEIKIDSYVLLFTLAISVVTGILFGLAPAFQGANANPQEALKEGTRGAGGGRRRLESVFVAVETGVAVILLAGAGLMMQSVWRLLQVDPGFSTTNMLTAEVALSPKVMANPAGIRLAYRQLIDRVAGIPGVRSAAVTSLMPLGDNDSEDFFWLGAGPQPPQAEMKSALMYIVTPDYHKAMQIPLREGRFFTPRDDVAAAPIVLIDQVLAKHVFPGQGPVGRQISLMGMGAVQIVGVVGHVKQWGLDSDDSSKIRDQIYFPLLQIPDKFMAGGVTGQTLVLRSEPNPLTLIPAVRAQVAGPTKDQPIYSVQTMEQLIARSVAERRFTMLVLVIFAATALLLAAIGIYGVMSYAVTRRIHELGIRTALGASRGEIVGLIVGQGMKLAAVGLLGGLIVAVALTRFMASLLYGVRPADPMTLGCVTLLLGSIALLACYIPARRATTVDPVVALRGD